MKKLNKKVGKKGIGLVLNKKYDHKNNFGIAGNGELKQNTNDYDFYDIRRLKSIINLNNYNNLRSQLYEYKNNFGITGDNSKQSGLHFIFLEQTKRH